MTNSIFRPSVGERYYQAYRAPVAAMDATRFPVRPRTPGDTTRRYTSTCSVPMPEDFSLPTTHSQQAESISQSPASRGRNALINSFIGRPSTAGSTRRSTPMQDDAMRPPSDPYVEGIRVAQVASIPKLISYLIVPVPRLDPSCAMGPPLCSSTKSTGCSQGTRPLAIAPAS